MVGSIKTTNLKDQTEMVACLHHLTVSMPIPELLYLFVKNRKCSYLKNSAPVTRVTCQVGLDLCNFCCVYVSVP